MKMYLFMELVFNFIVSYPFVVILLSFAIGYVTMPFILKIAIRKQMVVRPNIRTAHNGNIPNVGGLNIFTSFILAYLISVPTISDYAYLKYIIAGAYLIFLVGFLDDLLSFSAKKKLLGELLAGFLLIVVADVRLTNLHGFLGISEISDQLIGISYFVSFFLFLLIINALNLIDGVDGLATGVGMLICAFFGIYFQLVEKIELALMAYCFIGSMALFFIFNVFGKKSKIFMGDSGSLLLGYVVYVLVVNFIDYNKNLNASYSFYAAPAMAACVLAVPLFDTVRVMITRVKHGVSPFQADKNHTHHLLLGMGLKHREVTFILLLVTLSFIALALIGQNWKNSILGGATVVLAVGYTLLLWRLVGRYNKKKSNRQH